MSFYFVFRMESWVYFGLGIRLGSPNLIAVDRLCRYSLYCSLLRYQPVENTTGKLRFGFGCGNIYIGFEALGCGFDD